jgi:hypothetical protein
MVEDLDRLDRVEITIQPVVRSTYTCSDLYSKSRVSDRIDIIERKRYGKRCTDSDRLTAIKPSS